MPTTDDIVRFANISVPTITFDKAVPPSFIVQAQDDGCKVHNAIACYTALTCAGVKAEMHLFDTGGHGYGMRVRGKPTDSWPDLAATWLSGILEGAK